MFMLSLLKMAAHEVDVFSLTDINEIQKAYAQIHLNEQQLNSELDALLEDQPRLDAKMNTLQSVIPSLQLVMRDAQQLHSMISNTSDLAERVSSKVRTLDLVKSRVQETIRRVDDILDLKACVDGVQTALRTENYEQAAAHIHRYLNLDETILKEIIGDSKEDSDLSGAFTLLHEAEVTLKTIVRQKFETAIRSGDKNAVERFFKIFPLLGQHEAGLEKYAHYLSSQIALSSQKNLEDALEMKDSERHQNVKFASALTLLFESIARMVEEHQPLVETYYGPGRMFVLLHTLQAQCDKQASTIVEEFIKKRHFTDKLKAVQKSYAVKSSSSANLEKYDPRELDGLLRELVLMNARTELYTRFLKRRIIADMENLPEEEKPGDVAKVLDSLVGNSGLCRKMQELIGNYIFMEEFFMRETVVKAVSMDTFEGADDEVVTSSMVDDVFFIVQKSVRRALSSSSVDGVCAMLNHASALLSSDYRDVLSSKVRAGFPSGSLDLSGMLQGKLQVSLSSTAESAAAKKAFLVTLNNLEVSSENIQKLKKDLEVECARILDLGDAAKMKLESCLADLMATSNLFKDLLQEGIYQLCSTAIFSRLKPLIDAFSSISHNISEEEFSYYEVNDPFIQNFITSLSSLLSSFKAPLTAANYDTLVGMVTTEITSQMEKTVVKTSFNRLGGLQFDKELRALVGYLTAVTQWTIRDKFARLTQMATVLNLEKVVEIMEYWGANSGPLTWRLTPTEVRQVLSLRVDFRSEDINRLKL